MSNVIWSVVLVVLMIATYCGAKWYIQQTMNHALPGVTLQAHRYTEGAEIAFWGEFYVANADLQQVPFEVFLSDPHYWLLELLTPKAEPEGFLPLLQDQHAVAIRIFRDEIRLENLNRLDEALQLKLQGDRPGVVMRGKHLVAPIRKDRQPKRWKTRPAI